MARDSLQPDQERAIELLLGGTPLASVAVTLGVARSTVWRWTREERFAAELRAARVARAEAVREVLADGAIVAAKYLVAVVGDPKAGHVVRVKAAIALLDRAVGRPVVEPTMGVRVDGVERWPPLAEAREATEQLDKSLTALLGSLR